MIKKLSQRFLHQLPRYSFIAKGILRLSDYLFTFHTFAIPDQRKEEFSALFQQSKLNAEIIPFSAHTIWPFWVYDTLKPTSPHYTNHGNIPLLSNSSHRSWTTIGFPFSKSKIIIDPKGLLTTDSKTWSLDLWLSNQDTLISLSHLSPTQSFDATTGRLHTYAELNGVRLTSTVFLHQINESSEMVVNDVRLENTTESPISFSFYFAIRPYSPEGISPISSITYHSSGAFIIDNHLSLILDKTPSNIVCLNHKDGDISEHFNRWEMILKTECPSHLASAFAQYKVVLKANESKTYTCKRPTTFGANLIKGPITTLSPKKNTRLIELISKLKDYTFDTLSPAPYYTTPLTLIPEITLPQKKVESLFNTSIVHLISALNDTYLVSSNYTTNFKELFEVYKALCRIGKMDIVKAALSEFSSKKVDLLTKRSQHPIYIYTFIIRLTHLCYMFDKDDAFLTKTFPILEKTYYSIKKFILPQQKNVDGSGLLKPSTYSAKSGTKESLIITHYYVLHALENLSDLCITEDKLPLKEDITTTSHDLKISLNLFLKTVEDKHFKAPFLPVSLTQMTDYRLIENIETLFMNIYTEDDPKISNLIQWIEKQYCYNTIFYNNYYPNGYPIYSNALLAKYYLATLNPKAISIIQFIATTCLSTYALPEAIHPKTKFGSQGQGHSPLATASFINLILDSLIKIDGQSIHITPCLPAAWYEDIYTVIGISNVQTPFGTYSFTLKRQGDVYSLKQTTTFAKRPLKIIISFPFTIQQIHYKTRSRALNTRSCRLEHYDSEILFEVLHEHKK